ncbi:hypothetical protein BDW62DRAFT_19382 [Aspergillus aurantiobrunneus]
MSFGYVDSHLSLIALLTIPLLALSIPTLPLEISLWFQSQHLLFVPARSMMFMSSHPSCTVVTHVEKFVIFSFSCVFRTGLPFDERACSAPTLLPMRRGKLAFLIVASPLEFCLVWVLVGVWSLLSCSSIRDVLFTRQPCDANRITTQHDAYRE